MIAISAIVLFYGVNLMGLHMSSKTQNVLMVIKIGMILTLIAALFFPSLYNPQSQTLSPISDSITTNKWLLFGMALKAASFSYGGYQQTINFGEEVQNPQRVMPRGIVIGIFVIIALYLAVNFSYYKIIGFDELKNTRGIAAIVVGKNVWRKRKICDLYFIIYCCACLCECVIAQ
jgi:APA family basic amino acid/polyamine antiporter